MCAIYATCTEYGILHCLPLHYLFLSLASRRYKIHHTQIKIVISSKHEEEIIKTYFINRKNTIASPDDDASS